MEKGEYENCIFSECNFSDKDFSNSYNYALDPEENILKKAKFGIEGLPGLLLKYGIKVI